MARAPSKLLAVKYTLCCVYLNQLKEGKKKWL